MTYKIKFGTSGWRDRMDGEFNDNNVIRAASGMGEYLRGKKNAGPVAIAYDTRKDSQKFANTVAAVLGGMGFEVIISDGPAPVPALDWYVMTKCAISGIVITASHNPKEYNGVKLITGTGAPAPKEVTDLVESLIPESVQLPGTVSPRQVDMREGYLAGLDSRVDLSSAKGLKVVVDPMHGAGAGYLAKLLSKAGADVVEIRKNYDADFGGLPAPNPIGENTRMMIDAVKSHGATMGIANDGDADRCTVVDSNGKVYTTNEMSVIICDYLFGKKGVSGDVAANLTTTSALERLCSKFGRRYIETPVGFKYTGAELQKSAIIAVDSMNGLGMGNNWVADKDGMLTGALLCEAVTKQGTTLDRLWARVSSEYGYGQYLNYDMPVGEKAGAAIEHLKDESSGNMFGIMKITKRTTIDGIKLLFDDGSWICMRKSGTEPLVRVFVEARDMATVNNIMDAAKKLLGIEEKG